MNEVTLKIPIETARELLEILQYVVEDYDYRQTLSETDIPTDKAFMDEVAQHLGMK